MTWLLIGFSVIGFGRFCFLVSALWFSLQVSVSAVGIGCCVWGLAWERENEEEERLADWPVDAIVCFSENMLVYLKCDHNCCHKGRKSGKVWPFFVMICDCFSSFFVASQANGETMWFRQCSLLFFVAWNEARNWRTSSLAGVGGGVWMDDVGQHRRNQMIKTSWCSHQKRMVNQEREQVHLSWNDLSTFCFGRCWSVALCLPISSTHSEKSSQKCSDWGFMTKNQMAERECEPSTDHHHRRQSLD